MDFGVLFLLYLAAIVIGFALLIFFLLKYRKKTLQKNLSLTTRDLWPFVEARARQYGLDQSLFLYGIYQDEAAAKASMLIRNSTEEVLGKTLFPLAKRTYTITINDETYVMTSLLTWNTQFILQKQGGEKILAKWSQMSWLGKHQIEIPGFGMLESSNVSLDFKASYTYLLNGKIVGLLDRTIMGYPKGRLALLPLELPLPVRLFILSKV